MRHLIDFGDMTRQEWDALYRRTQDIIDHPADYRDACRGKVCASLPLCAIGLEQQCCHLMTINSIPAGTGPPETSHNPVTQPRLLRAGVLRQVGK